jgi:Bifunctional DNA primase/polymerase, N-terminal
MPGRAPDDLARLGIALTGEFADNAPPAPLSPRGDLALRYARKGIPVFPVTRGKRPFAGTRGYLDATTDAATIRAWWARWPDANIATSTGELFDVVDPDGPHGPALLAELVPEGMPDGPEVETGGGGRHFYVRPTGYPSATLRKAGPECRCTRRCRVDFKGQGGYVLLPGSRTTGRYRWGEGRELAGTLLPSGLVPDVPVMPAALVERLAARAARSDHTPPRGDGGEGVELPPEGEPKRLPEYLRKLAGRQAGVDNSGSLWELLQAGASWGLSDGELVYLGRRFAPAVEKYRARLDQEIARPLPQVRAEHQHPGQPCDAAGCLNTPKWMRRPKARRGKSTPPPDDQGPEVDDDRGDDRCPAGVILVRRSGRVQRFISECDKWGCPRCGPRRARVVAARVVMLASGGPIYAGELALAGDRKAATRAAQRQKVSRVALRLAGGGALLVASAHLAARDFVWSLRQVAPEELAALLQTYRIERISWSADWRPEPEASKVVTDPVVGCIYCGPQRVEDVLKRSGVVAGAYATVAPEAAAERIRSVAHGRRRPSEHFHTPPR